MRRGGDRRAVWRLRHQFPPAFNPCRQRTRAGGNKLPVEGLYEAILYPSNAISHGYATVSLTTRSGDELAGFVSSETTDKITLRMAGGLSRDIASRDIATRTDLELSLMPPGLAARLTPQELAARVAYLATLEN